MLSDKDKTKEQLIKELGEMRQRVAEVITVETERKRVDEEYGTILRTTMDGFWLADMEGRFLDLNNAYCRLIGYSRDELLKMRIPDIEAIEKLEETAARIARIRKVGGDRFETRHRCKDGKIVDVEVSVNYLGAGGGRMVVFIRDITERKRAEEALQESEERYRALVNLGGSVGEAIIMLQDTEQGEGIQTFVSDEWPPMTGYSRKELLGMSFSDLLHPKCREASLKRYKRRMGGEVVSGLYEMSIIRKDGAEVPIELTSAYTTYKGERANVAFIRDITERKEAEEREKELQRELNLASRLASVGELAAGVAHEINNPLTGILGFSERLLRKSTDEKTTRDLEKIHSEALRAAKVVQNLRTFARRRESKKEYVNINDIVPKALELRAYELKTGNIEVVTDLTPRFLWVLVDFYQIQEVFLNIILNAEQAMTEANSRGKLSIKTRRVGGYIRASFTDDGPGIPADQLGKVFDPFFTTRGKRVAPAWGSVSATVL